MSRVNKYLQKHRFTNLLTSNFSDKSKYAVIIPACNEPDLLKTIHSLWKSTPISAGIEIIVVINHAADTSTEIVTVNTASVKALEGFAVSNVREGMQLHVLKLFGVNKKFAGVGYARKVGMDHAIMQFDKLGQETGILISLDADCQVAENYFVGIHQFYCENPQAVGANIYFEHVPENEHLSEGAMLYEIYLRYYKNALAYTGFPYPYHTVGSCFSSTANRYVLQGGMGKQQGGEDFYFLNKLFPTGPFGEINNTVVEVSSRTSDRVPFGTGPAIERHNKDNSLNVTYAFDLFEGLKVLFGNFRKLYKAPDKQVGEIIESSHACLKHFLKKISFKQMVDDANRNTGSEDAFVKRMFNSFNAFQVVKFMNDASEACCPKQNTIMQVSFLLQKLNIKTSEDPAKILNVLREIDKGSI